MRFKSIQALRGLAAFMVVLFHLELYTQRLNLTNNAVPWLSYGVDLFFVISGFIMWVTTYGRPVTPQGFMMNRIRRIVPLYWAVTTFYVAVALFAPGSTFSAEKLDVIHTVTSYLFIPHKLAGSVYVEPLVHPGWSLNYEMYFYVIFAATLFVRGTWRLPIVAIVFASIFVLGGSFTGSSLVVDFYSSSIIFEFLFGMIVGHLYTSGRIASVALVVPALIVFFVCAIANFQLEVRFARVLAGGIPAAILLYAAVSLEKTRGLRTYRIPLEVGNSSYSLYLTHTITLSAGFQAWRFAGGMQHPIGVALFFVVAPIAAVLVGYVCYRLVEQPIERRLNGNTSHRFFEAHLNEFRTPRRLDAMSLKPIEQGDGRDD